MPPIGDLNYKPGTGVADGTIANLGRSLLVAFGLPDQADRLFADHVTLAIGVHVAQTYGGLRPISRPVRGASALAGPLLSRLPSNSELRRISGCSRSESIQPKIYCANRRRL